MPITAAAYYRQAAEQKNTLAAANLAQTMIGAGLVDEAQRLLDGALKEEKVDPRVHRAASRLAADKEEEAKRLEKIREGAKAERQLLRDRADVGHAHVDPVKVEDVTGSWQTSVGVVAFQSEGGKLVARFDEGPWQWVLEGTVTGRTYVFTWKCSTYLENNEGDGFFLFTSGDRFEGLIRHTPRKGDVGLVNGRHEARADVSTTSQAPDEILDRFLRGAGKN
jgi:hypothetical protein